jgi:hypothetical protein
MGTEWGGDARSCNHPSNFMGLLFCALHGLYFNVFFALWDLNLPSQGNKI